MDIFTFIKTKISILDVVGEYTTLKKAGNYWKSACPFHYEKTGSFTVSPHKEIFYCFGCQAGGDVIAFIAKAEHCSQLEAARYLAERYSISLPETMTLERSEETTEKKNRYNDLCALMAHWGHDQLLKNSSILAYLASRGIDKVSIENFMLGYFPAGYNAVKNFLDYAHKKQFLATDFIEIRLLLESTNSHTLYSPFEDRLLFPISDHMSRVCGFGGRIVRPGDERPKYYNSHDHDFFNKSSLVFGLDRAKKAIQKTGSVFLVEGYIDCIAMAQAGFENTVATLGTACTREHLKTIARYAEQLYVVYDGDAAGQKAIIRLTQLCWDFDIELLVIQLPEKEDPASYLVKKGDFQALISQAQDIFMFFIEHMGLEFRHKRLQERIELTKQCIETIASVKDPLKQDLLLQKAAMTFSLPFETLKQELNKAGKKQSPAYDHEEENTPVLKKTENFLKEIPHLEKKLFSAIINDSSVNSSVVSGEDLAFLIRSLTPPLTQLLAKLAEQKTQQTPLDFTRYFDSLAEEERLLVSNILLEAEQQQSSYAFNELFEQFQKKQWKMIINNVKIKLAQAQQSSDTEMVKKILADFQEMKHTMIRKGLI